MVLFINFLGVRAGGQITRAYAFYDKTKKIKNIDFVYIKYKDTLKSIVNRDNCKVVEVDYYPFKSSFITNFFFECFQLKKYLKSYKADTYLSFSNILPFLFPKNIKTIIGISNLAPFVNNSFEDANYFMKIRMYIKKKMILNSCYKADSILALSNLCKEILCQNGLEDDKIFVAPNGVDPFWSRKSTMTNSDLNITKNYILYVSHFHFYKNHLRLIEAFALFHKKYKTNLKLFLIGDTPDIDYFNKVKKRIKDLNISEKIFIKAENNIFKLRHYYQKSRFFIFPSLIENSPNILLEAMMSNCVILSGDCDPMPEFGGDTLSYFDAFNYIDIFKKLEKEYLTQKLNNIENNKVYKKAKNYSWQHFANCIIKQAHKLEK